MHTSCYDYQHDKTNPTTSCKCTMALARKDSDSSDGGSVANDDGIDVTVEDSAKLLNGSTSRGGDGGASHRAGRYMDDDDEDMEGGSHRDLKVQCVLICLGLVVAAVFAMLLAEVLRQGEPQRPPAGISTCTCVCCLPSTMWPTTMWFAMLFEQILRRQ